MSDRSDWLGVARAACEEMTEPAYAAWRGITRQAYARYVADQLSLPAANLGDRLVGVAAFAVCVAVAVYGAWLWVAMK